MTSSARIDALGSLVCALLAGLVVACGESSNGASTDPSAPAPFVPPGALSPVPTTAPTGPGTSPMPTPGSPGASACKRGVAYGYHSEADMKALKPGISWWYNWAFLPDTGVRTTFANEGIAYVPMVWGTKVDPAAVQREILPGAPALLGFNEPNFFSQANLSPEAAAKAWPAVQAVADAHGLPLVSPAVNFCGGGCHGADPFAYLDSFFAACPGCRVDAIAVHIYVGCKGEAGNRAKWMVDHLKTYERRFTQPIWLTELACDDAASPADAEGFARDAVTYLESDPRVVRYAWFSGRTTEVKNVDLLGADGQLTVVGKAYVNAPENAACMAERKR